MARNGTMSEKTLESVDLDGQIFSDFSSKAKTTLDGPIYRVISNRLSEEESPKTYEYVMIKFLIIVSEVYRTLLLKLQATMPLVRDLHQDSESHHCCSL